MNKQELFVCSIGPVQTFIAAARSSRDLAYSSQLLSELAKAIARTVTEKEGFDALIFPAPASQDELKAGSALSVANKVVAIVQSDPVTLADEIEGQTQSFLLQQWHPIAKDLGKDVDQGLAEWQLKDLIEFYWVAAPLPNENEYPDVRDRCERALAARKATRDFSPHQGKARFKSSIDGVREHVMSLVPDQASSPTPKQMQRYKVRRGELLSGVDLLKRWGKLRDEKAFKSTSHMAALPFMEGLGDENAKALFDELVALFERHGATSFVRDYSVVHPSEVRAAFGKEDIVDTVLREQEEILRKYAGSRRPGVYYALLLADGDNMGETISAQETPEDHRKLSQALSEFAQQVPGIVDKHKGITVYAGGDDVLAYLPVHTALDCVEALAEEFAKRMKGFLTKEGVSPTLSAGLVIVHHLEPLSDVLELARSTEKTAKTVEGKDALAITLSKRSGAERRVKGHLLKSGDEGQTDTIPLAERLQTMVQWWRAGMLSKGTLYEFERLARTMENVLPERALRAEAIPILKRKRESEGNGELAEEVISAIERWLKTVSLSELAREMIIAAEIANAQEMAGSSQDAQEGTL